MNIKRIKRISGEVKRAMTEILYDGLKDPRIAEMTTITDVEVTRDLSYANIYVSVLGDEKSKRDTIEGLKNAQGYIRTEIGQKVDLRHVPKPVFHLDETTEHAMRINKLINEAKKQGNENE